MVRPPISPTKARVLGAVLGVAGFASISLSGIVASNVHADVSSQGIPAKSVWLSTSNTHNLLPQNTQTFTCQADSIDVWAFNLGQSNGTYQVFWDDPNANSSRKQIMSGTYHFDQSDRLSKQVLVSIDIHDLVDDLAGHHHDTAQGGGEDGAWHLHVVVSNPYHSIKFNLRDNCDFTSTESSTPPPVPVVQQQAPVPTPAPVVAGTTTAAPKAAAVVPETGADVPFLAGLLLMSAGGSALGFARRFGRKGR